MALVVGTNAGFVTTAPTGDPEGSPFGVNGVSWAFKDVSPEGATKVIEIGWYKSNSTGFNVGGEVGLYTHNSGDDNPEELLGSAGFTLDQSEGWDSAVVDIAITGGVTYWLAIQGDAHADAAELDRAYTGTDDSHSKTGQTELTNPWGVSSAESNNILAIYAVYETAVGFTRKIKISGTFQDKPIKEKKAGTFEDKPISIKVGGTFQDA